MLLVKYLKQFFLLAQLLKQAPNLRFYQPRRINLSYIVSTNLIFSLLSHLLHPGTTRAIIPLLNQMGIRALSIGVNGATSPADVPPVFLWKNGNYSLVTLYHPGDWCLSKINTCVLGNHLLTGDSIRLSKYAPKSKTNYSNHYVMPVFWGYRLIF